MKLSILTQPTYRNTQYPMDPQATLDQIARENIGGEKRIIDYVHPDYEANKLRWTVFRDTYKGGRDFINKYVRSYSSREEPLDFAERKNASYCPALAKAAIVSTKNALTSRFPDIKRLGGAKTYREAVVGDKFGVDRLGSTMNTFLTRHVVGDLLSVEKVGVYIDKPVMPDNPSMLDTLNKRPYLYRYKAEDIVAWADDETHEPNQYSVLLLRDNILKKDDKTGLPIKWICRYRYLRKVGPNSILLQFYNEKGDQTDFDNNVSDKNYEIKLSVIPFVVFEISQSLLEDICDYQIALVNMASADVGYTLGMNFPFYTEQYDPASEAGALKTGALPEFLPVRDGVLPRNPGQLNNERAVQEIRIGKTTGRRYPLKADRPGFINPSPEPMLASMKKQSELKNEIKEILASNLSNMSAKSVPEELQADDDDVESGLFNVGIELEHGERRIASIWSLYEEDNETININYPLTYETKSDKERREEATELNEIRSTVPSVSFQKEVAVQMVHVLLDGKITDERMTNIENEIQDAKTMTSAALDIASDLENGLVSDATASEARGYAPGEVVQAKLDHAARIERIQMAQQSVNASALTNPGARGLNDLNKDPKAAKNEKTLSQTNSGGLPDPEKKRGEAE